MAAADSLSQPGRNGTATPIIMTIGRTASLSLLATMAWSATQRRRGQAAIKGNGREIRAAITSAAPFGARRLATVLRSDHLPVITTIGLPLAVLYQAAACQGRESGLDHAAGPVTAMRSLAVSSLKVALESNLIGQRRGRLLGGRLAIRHLRMETSPRRLILARGQPILRALFPSYTAAVHLLLSATCPALNAPIPQAFGR